LLMYSGHASTHTCSGLTAGVLYTIHVETFLNSSASESAQSNRIRIFTSECVCVSTMASSRAVFAEEGGRFDLLAENSWPPYWYSQTDLGVDFNPLPFHCQPFRMQSPALRATFHQVLVCTSCIIWALF